MKEIIKATNLTKDYGNGHGIFNVSFSVNEGETFGFVGTNGSGKTTIIRHLMGFLKPQSGSASINGYDSWNDACVIKKDVQYVPGEIAFPDLKDGNTFLKSQAQLLGLEDLSKANKLIKKLQLDPTANLKRMSKGMKQKTAIVAAMMADKNILILDEPTTGLDPLMRENFLEIIREEKKSGKTILMSSQSFSELESTCDKVALIFNGKIIDIADIQALKNQDTSNFKIEFLHKEEYDLFKNKGYTIVRDQVQFNQVTVNIKKTEINKLILDLKPFKIKFITEVKFNLEKYFKDKLISLEKGGENV